MRRISILLSTGLVLAACIGAPACAEVAVQQTAGEIRLQARDATVAEIFSALQAKFAMTSRGAPTKRITGLYTGSLRQILARVLEGYDYVIEPHGGSLEVIVVGNGAPRAPQPAVTVHRRAD